jgi:hypothetical protein
MPLGELHVCRAPRDELNVAFRHRRKERVFFDNRFERLNPLGGYVDGGCTRRMIRPNFMVGGEPRLLQPSLPGTRISALFVALPA